MVKKKAYLIARIVYLVDLALTTVAFFTVFFLRDVVLPAIAPSYFPTGLFPISEYLKIYPLVLILWSALLFTYHSYHSHRTIPLTRETATVIRVVFVGNVLLAPLAYLMPLRQLSHSCFLLFAALPAMFRVTEKIFLRFLPPRVALQRPDYP